MLVSRLEHIADEKKKCVTPNRINFITYVSCVLTVGPARLVIIWVYILCIDPADAQADLGVPCSHMP